ncbi:MAG: hypothetical protein M1825_001023 [Sarcosagium campestre]|nr:MAG: hypothetical protein M1825_001023 [Sarcosagium campestre]
MSEVSFRMATGLGQAQWKLVLAYPKLVESRNDAAHKTELDFARLLCSPEKINGPLYYTWAPFFDYCFEKTIEEMAAAGISKEAELIAILTGTG